MSHGNLTDKQVAAFRVADGEKAKGALVEKLKDDEPRIDIGESVKRMLERNQAISDSKDRNIVAMFKLEQWQLSQVVDWSQEHECSITYGGAIGGQHTYQFTNTSMGQVVKCVCACGSETDISAYEEW